MLSAILKLFMFCQKCTQMSTIAGAAVRPRLVRITLLHPICCTALRHPIQSVWVVFVQEASLLYYKRPSTPSVRREMICCFPSSCFEDSFSWKVDQRFYECTSRIENGGSGHDHLDQVRTSAAWEVVKRYSSKDVFGDPTHIKMPPTIDWNNSLACNGKLTQYLVPFANTTLL